MKKYVMALAAAIAFCAVLMLSGCASRDADLVGTWVHEFDVAFYSTYQANGNGTHSEPWGDYGDTFIWTTSRNNINWNYVGHSRVYTPYVIDNDELRIYYQDGSYERFFRERQDAALIGTWVWDANPAYVTTFNENGTGNHTITWGFGTNFTWTTSGPNLIHDYPGHGRLGMWYEMRGNALYFTMPDGTVYRYTRQN